MKHKSIFILVLFLTLTTLKAQDPNLHIYLCFGQSNMEGQGKIEEKDKLVSDRFKVFQSLDCSAQGRSKNKLYPAVPPLCQCSSGLSPADYFGRTLVENLPDSIKVAVINVAVGGCDIRLFDKFQYEGYTQTYNESWFKDKIRWYGGNPYEHLISLAKAAQKEGVIKGILLHQGETNTGNVAWPNFVKTIYNYMMADLSLNPNNVPLIAGEVVHEDQNGKCAAMNPIINELPNVIKTAHVVSSSGCPDSGDDVHFSSEGYRMLGRRYGEKMLSILGYESVALEAECGDKGKAVTVQIDKIVSNEKFVTHTNATSEAETEITLKFKVNYDGEYYIYGLLNNALKEGDAFRIKVDNGAAVLMDNLTTNGWEWRVMLSSFLKKGKHTITISFAEKGGQLDKIILKNSRIAPINLGNEAINTCK